MILMSYKKEIQTILNNFSNPDYYLSRTGIERAINNKTMFNLIDSTTGDKVDFWIYQDNAFDRSRFSRKIQRKIMGIMASFL
ncbi:MAG: hypothetical protein ACOCQN_00180 [Halanaerobiaceae bacterium]